jgi:hypothetical protein
MKQLIGNWREIALRVNQRLIDRKEPDFSGLSPASIRLIKETQFTAEQINAAFAEARRLVRKRAGIE